MIPSLARGYAIKSLQAILAFATGVVLARLLSPAEFGSYSVSMSITLFLASVFSFGLHSLAQRRTWSLSRRTRRTAWLFHSILSASLIGSLASTVVMFAVQSILLGSSVALSAAWAAVAGLVALAPVLVATNKAAGSVMFANLIDLNVRQALMLGLVLVVPAVLDELHATVALLASYVVGLAILAARLPSGWWFSDWRDASPGIVKLSWVLGVASVVWTISQYVDQVLVGIVGGDVTAAEYRVAMLIAQTAAMGTAVIDMMITPRLVTLMRSGKQKELSRLLGGLVAVSSAVCGLALLGYVVLGEALLGIVFGVQYRQAFWPGVVALSAQFVIALTGPGALVLLMSGSERLYLRLLMASAALTSLLCTVLVPALGPLGAAVSSSVSLIALNATCMVLSGKIAGVSTTASFRDFSVTAIRGLLRGGRPPPSP